VRYLTLAEALTIAEAVTRIEVRTYVHITQLGLLDSALHAPQASFGEVEFHPAPGRVLVKAGSGIWLVLSGGCACRGVGEPPPSIPLAQR
jgi:hypothetical protein